MVILTENGTSQIKEFSLNDAFPEIFLKKGKLITTGIRKYSDEIICSLYLDLKNAGVKITESFLYEISGPNRKMLKIPSCSDVKASSLNYFFFNSPNLEVIDLSNCYQVNNRVIKSIISNCHNLKELHINGCKLVTDSAFKTELFSPVGSCLYNLKVLNIGGCPQIVNLHSIIKQSKDLEFLNVSFCRNLTLSTFEDILQCCVNLKELDISSCDGIDDRQEEFNCRTNNNVEKIIISRSKLSSSTLEKIIRSLKNLKVLDLKYNINMNDEIFNLIVKNLPDLNTLFLRNCANISDKSFSYLDNNLKKLEHLDVSWCPLLTSKTLKYLAIRYSEKDIKKLKSLKLSQSTNLGSVFETEDCDLEYNTYKNKIPRLSLDNKYDSEIEEDTGLNLEVKFLGTEKLIDFKNKKKDIENLDNEVYELIKKSKIETKLTGGGLTPLSLCCIIKFNSDSLTSLELDGLRDVITSDVLEHIGVYCKKLRNLSISICEFDDLNIASFNKICTQCINLENFLIDISPIESRLHNSSIIESLSSKGCLPKLKELVITFNSKLGFSNEDLDLISRCNFRLYKLEINNVKGISHDYIKDNYSKLTGLFSSIRKLSLSQNDEINDEDLICILNMIKNPNSIELINFQNISSELPLVIWNKFSSIKYLNINDNKNKILLERY